MDAGSTSEGKPDRSRDAGPGGDRADDPDRRAAERRTRILLSIGVATGLIVATAALVSPTSSTPARPADAVAVVNGVVIRQDDYLRLLSGFESDSKSPADAEARRHVLDRMIDEELLVQRALDLGLATVDRRVRSDLTSSLITSIVTTAEDREPEPEELEAFYEEESEFFTRPGRLHVRQVFFRVPPGSDEDTVRARADEARQALVAGRPFDEVVEEYGDEEVSPIPDTLLPALKLREYVGPSALRAALDLETGALSEPVRSGIGYHVLSMVDRTPNTTPPLGEIEDQVRNEWRRRAGDRALRAYLDQLRDEGDVEVLLDAPSEASS